MKISMKRKRIRRLGEMQNDKCFFCDQPLQYIEEERPEAASLDHYHSRKNGGSGQMINLVVSCMKCNSDKGHLPTPEYDEKFQQLNERRGFSGSIMSYLDSGRYGKPSLALIELTQYANNIDNDGVWIRSKISKKINDHMKLISQLRVIHNTQLRMEALLAIQERRNAAAPLVLGDPYLETLFKNVIKTLTRQACRDGSRSD